MELENIEQINEVLSSPSRKIIEFYAKWCPPCRMLAVILEEFEELHPDILIYRIDTIKFKEIAVKYRALGVPVLLVLENGEVVNRFDGFLEVEDIEKWYYKNEEE